MTLGPAFPGVLEAARDGAPWALRELYDDLAPAVHAYLRANGAEDAADLTSETFVGVLRGLPRFRGEEADLRAWVFTIAHRRVIDQRRRRARRPAAIPLGAVVDEPATGDVAEEVLASSSAQRVAEVLAHLTADQRDVLLLRVVAQLDVEEVAHVLRRRPGAVRALQHRGVRALRAAVGERHRPPERQSALARALAALFVEGT